MAPGRKTGGRTSKLTDAVTERICEAIEKDMLSLTGAAALAGVHRKSLWDWRARGEQDLDEGRDTVFARLALRIALALARVERDLVRKWRLSRAWRKWETMLARKFPQEWGSQLKIQGDPDAPLRAEVAGIDIPAMLHSAEFRRAAAELSAIAAAVGALHTSAACESGDRGSVPSADAPEGAD